MAEQSPFVLAKQLEVEVSSRLRALDVLDYSSNERKILTALTRELSDARLDVRDYELSETRAEQLACAKTARRRLEQVRRAILQASEFGVFSAVDVAQLTATVEHIIDCTQ